MLADLFDSGVLALVEEHLVLLEHVAALRVDGDDERAELLHLAAPQGFGHAQLIPVVLGDALHLGSRDHGAACREHAVNGAKIFARALGILLHAALADDDAHASIIVTVIFSYFVFKEKLSKKAFAGICLMVVGTLLMVFFKQ